jgi:hypothetical protein
MRVLIETHPEERSMGLCVITEWDDFCTKDNLWQQNIGRFNLNHPFYSFIKEDGSEAYIAQGKNL